MNTYKNQKVIGKINRAKITKGNYNRFSTELMDYVWTDLQDCKGAFSIWLYMNQHCNPKNQLGFSPTAVANLYKLNYKVVQRSVGELIEKGYLKLLKGNVYEWYDDPRENKNAPAAGTVAAEETAESVGEETVGTVGELSVGELDEVDTAEDYDRLSNPNAFLKWANEHDQDYLIDVIKTLLGSPCKYYQFENLLFTYNRDGNLKDLVEYDSVAWEEKRNKLKNIIN